MEIDDISIKKYISGDLSVEETSFFQQQLEQDPELQKTVQYLSGLYESAQQAEAWAELEDMQAFTEDASRQAEGKAALQALLQESTTTPKRRLMSAWSAWAIAAVLLALVSVALWRWSTQPPGIVAFEPEGLIPLMEPTSAGALSQVLNRGIQAYQSKDYQWLQDSVPVYQGLYPFNEDYIPPLIFLQGMTFFEEKDYLKASEVLSQLPAIHSEGLPLWKYQAYYYLAMSYYKTGKNKEALHCLQGLERFAPTDFKKSYLGAFD